MIEADRADHSRAKLDHDLIVPITSPDALEVEICQTSFRHLRVSFVEEAGVCTEMLLDSIMDQSNSRGILFYGDKSLAAS